MTTRTPPTEADIRGETQAGRDAYNERRRYCRDNGLAVPPDLYGQDELDDESDPTGAQRFWRDMAARTAQSIEHERETTRLVNLANDGIRKRN